MQAETTYSAILGQILKELRKNNGMDQSDIAEKMGMNRSSWSRIESGNTMMTIQQLQKASDILSDTLKIEANEILLKADTVAKAMKDKGYTVHYDSPKEIQEKSSGTQGLALIGAAALGLFVGSVLFGGNNANADDKDEKNKP